MALVGLTTLVEKETMVYLFRTVASVVSKVVIADDTEKSDGGVEIGR